MIGAVLLVGALVLVPGIGAALAIAPPGAIRVETRLALAFGLGYGIVAGLAVALAVVHAFVLPSFVVGVVVLTAAVWTLPIRRAGLRAHARAIGNQAREAPFIVGGGLAVVVASALVWVFFPPAVNLAHRPPWRYWADGLEVAAAGHVPATSSQWGTEIPTTVSKVTLNSFEGGISFLLGPEPLPAMHGMLVLAAVGTIAALLALGRELGLGIFSPLVPLVAALAPGWLPFSHEIADHLSWFTAETVGRMVALCGLLAGIILVRRRSGVPLAVVVGMLLAAAALTHGVPALIAALALLFFALGTALVERSDVRRLAISAGVAAVTLAGSYVGVIGLSGGDLGFQAAGGGSFEGFSPEVDPTRSFGHGTVMPPRSSGSFVIAPTEIARRYAEELAGGSGPTAGRLALILALALASVVTVLLARRLVPLTVAAWGPVAVSLLLALFFSYRYSTAVPGDFGPRRLDGYVILLPALVLPGLLSAVARPLFDRRRLAGQVVAVVVAALAVVAAFGRFPERRSFAPARAGVSVIERVAGVVPCDARMLVNWRTAGTWEATIGRRAITEGHAPFLRPRILGFVLPTLLGANRFFDDPEANVDYLASKRVDYLVVVDRAAWIGTNGPRFPKTGDAAAVAALPFVEPVVEDRFVSIFRVDTGETGPEPPERCPL
jgi:hypothetical protein